MNILSSRIQESNVTAFNRYPTIFTMISRFSNNERKEADFSLLSFGQSSNDKVIFYDSISKETFSKEYSFKKIIKE